MEIMQNKPNAKIEDIHRAPITLPIHPSTNQRIYPKNYAKQTQRLSAVIPACL